MRNKGCRTKVLFVCVGNACRSPMAEAIARLDASDVIEASSAGLAPIEAVAGMTKQTLLRNGCRVEDLEPKGISAEVWEQADIIINLSGRSLDQAFRESSKVRDWDVEDPFGRDIEIYQRVFEEIRLRVAELADECRKVSASARTAERRARARLGPTSPIFVNLNGTTAGVVLNISEDGLAISATAALPVGPLHSIWIHFPGHRHWIEAGGKIAWKSESDQEAGIKFLGLTEETAQSIGNWISSQAFPGALEAETRRILETENVGFKVPGVLQTVGAIPEFYARRKKRSGKNALRPRLKHVPDETDPGAAELGSTRTNPPRRKWGTFAAIGVMTGLISLTFEWVMVRRDVQSDTVTSDTPKTVLSNEGIPDLTRPLIPELPDIPSPSPKMDISAHPAARPPETTSLKAPSLPMKSVLARGQAMKDSALPANAVNSRYVEKVRPLAAGSVPARPAQEEEAKVAPPVISSSNLPIDSAQVGLKEMKNLPPPPKQSTTPTVMTAAVAILADPYPSLRIPDGGTSKKQRQATSLQLGHLLTRVEPIYPEEARQQGIQGTVKLHAIIGRQGSVEDVRSLDGSPVLVAAAMNAVRQWRYTETLLAGQSVETEEDIAITFRLSNSGPPTNQPN